MDSLSDLFHKLMTPEEAVRWGGYTALAGIVFAETGLLIGFFLPGDSLLFIAGFLAGSTDLLDIWTLNALLMAAAIAGDTTGYWIGRKSGPHLFTREKSLLFRPDYLRKAHDFYERNGPKTIVIARFVPIIRTFAPVVAGIGEMNYHKFIAYNVFGGIGWVAGMTLLGYFLGSVPWVKANLEKVILLIVFLSILPGIIEVWRHWRAKPAS